MGGRRQNKLELRGNVYIVGEGITEQYYFSHLKFLKKFNYVVKPRFFGKTSISEIDKSVAKLLLGGVTVICVFDTDVSSRDSIERENLNRFRRKYAKNRNVILCDSFPSIEFWFLLHFVKTTRNFGTVNEILTALRKYIPDFSKERSFLEDIRWVAELCQNDKLTQALESANQILTEREKANNAIFSPYTNIVKGIEWITNKGSLIRRC